jgi:hypothetical protein
MQAKASLHVLIITEVVQKITERKVEQITEFSTRNNQQEKDKHDNTNVGTLNRLPKRE